MSDGIKILLTALASVTVSTLVFIFGEFATKLFFDPIQEHRKAIGELAFVLGKYSNIYTNTDGLIDHSNRSSEEYKEYQRISAEFRTALMRLMTTAQMINWYCLWRLCKLIPCKREELAEVQRQIVLLTQYAEQEGQENKRLADGVKNLLKISVIKKLE